MASWPARRRREPLEVVYPPGYRAQSIYEDGTYLISALGEARTWAVCTGGRWGVVYEVEGAQPVSGWVDPSQIPLDVRARALRASEEHVR